MRVWGNLDVSLLYLDVSLLYSGMGDARRGGGRSNADKLGFGYSGGLRFRAIVFRYVADSCPPLFLLHAPFKTRKIQKGAAPMPLVSHVGWIC